ncbi:DUF3048 domain-containing protein [Natranaerobius thermophilus]|uniref:DUF3048 domain-containing protein n=1 Tax=Natranaerobius thermophilus (strain ATCC BAA-1301 / DSM 18059 / JW/NM-WN-LF) TaxID=457570 RepID=B2A8M7_NATTJ|nr:DUF3048 domain-containing protein [Natranaerobius thermophilus]ACB85911.1 conserved hypothetical protein [Natranaerobius thermophilus JW/NM-WN-LF]
MARNYKRKKKKLKLKKLPLAITSLILVLLVTGGLYAILSDDEAAEPSIPEKEEEKEKEEPDPELELVEVPRCEYCGGEMEDEEKELSRPVTVTYGNTANERPQSGINSACIMYEAPAEGSLTRLQAVFKHQHSEKIGPIRSARYYLVTLALEHDALYAHIQGYQPVMNKIRDKNVATLNEYGDASYFWRSEDRRAPFNAYTNIENLLEAAESRGYRPEGQRDNFITYNEEFSKEFINHAIAVTEKDDEKDHTDIKTSFIATEAGQAEVESAEEITINYGRGNLVEYQYNEEDRNYQRYINEDPHVDQADEEQITAQDLIIQYVDSRVIDDQGRRRLGMIGEGEAKYLADGKVVPLTWEKDDHDEPTEFYHAETEEPLELRPGLTWINIVPYGTEISY